MRVNGNGWHELADDVVLEISEDMRRHREVDRVNRALIREAARFRFGDAVCLFVGFTFLVAGWVVIIMGADWVIGWFR